MARSKIEPINRDIDVMLDESFSPKAQALAFAEFAHEQIEDAKQTNQTILGRLPRYTVSVDGRIGAPLESVRPDGVIVTEFELFNDVLAWIGDQLVTHSPVKSGQYQKSHTLFADGVETDVGQMIPPAAEYVFMNSVPYARKIETGSSSQAPDGVYQAIATLAARRFGNVGKISFTYRSMMGGAIGAWSGSASARRHAAANRKHSGSSDASRSEWLTRQPAILVKLGDR